ncbi:MAG: hypothetical protein Tsb0032_42950 [Kiloniellaceae bacterium]
MTTVDDSLNEAPSAGGGRWQHPRLLAVLFVLALGSSINAVLSGGLFGSEPWKGVTLFDETGVIGDFGVLGTEGRGWDQAKTCGRIHQIVETACGLKQRDHDVTDIRQCVAYELKYTMWSAYGCR